MTLSDGFPPFYATRPTAVFYDVTHAYLIFAAITLFVGMLLVLPGVRGKDRKYFVLRWVVALFGGTSILACIFGFSWHEAVIDTYLPNRAQGHKLSRFEVGLYVGLNSFNVTLREVGDNVGRNPVNYNEDFTFLKVDGDVTAGLERGIPAPILDVAEFFTTQNIAAMNVWGRRYWLAGRYAKYMLWAAFANWLVGNILLSTFVKFGGLSRILNGFLMLGANVSFASVQSYCCELEIRLGYRDEMVLKPAYGWSFYLCLVVGLVFLATGAVITISSYMCSAWIHRFFNLERAVEEPFIVDIDKSPQLSRQSSSSQAVKEETMRLRDEAAHSSMSGGELSRKDSLQKIEFLAMDSNKPSTSNGNGTENAFGAAETTSAVPAVTTTDL